MLPFLGSSDLTLYRVPSDAIIFQHYMKQRPTFHMDDLYPLVVNEICKIDFDFLRFFVVYLECISFVGAFARLENEGVVLVKCFCFLFS
jgi:hypothetical protein